MSMKSSHTVVAWITILAAGAFAGRLDTARCESPDPAGSPAAGQTETLDLSLQRIRTADSPAGTPTAKGHYQHLLRQIEAPKDKEQYGDFYDYGYWSGTTYAGQQNLPPGYWVYLAPNWYIYQVAAPGSPGNSRAPRPWGPEQATGAPDTWPNSGDLTTAWASATPDGQREWLELTYDGPVRPVAVMIYETYNPGAVDRVAGYDANGHEVELWSGADPTPAGKDKGISIIPLHPDFDLSRIRISLNSPGVSGWNEIDAVGLLDSAGKTHWATSATASSSYADRASPQPGDAGAPRLEELNVEHETGALRSTATAPETAR